VSTGAKFPVAPVESAPMVCNETVSVRPFVCLCHLVSSWGPFNYPKDGEKDTKRRAKVSLPRPTEAYTEQNLNAVMRKID